MVCSSVHPSVQKWIRSCVTMGGKDYFADFAYHAREAVGVGGGCGGVGGGTTPEHNPRDR